MVQTYDAIVDEQGNVRLLEQIHISGAKRALVVVLDEAAIAPGETALLSEAALGEDWNRPAEDSAWTHLQQAKLS